ncbi:MAG: radical SAM protein [Nitrospirae bacterium]|nr:radical SAM protein [Nitrospirota bacterium]
MNAAKLYEKILGLHALIPYHAGRGRAFPPIRVQLEITGRCNLRCQFCYQDKAYKQGSGELTYDEIISIIDQAPRYALITLSGGEPLLKENIAAIIEHAASKHYCNMITNGLLLSRDTVRLMVERKFTLVNVSLDGIGSLHDELRGVKGVFDRIRENLLFLRDYRKEKKSRFPLLDIKTVITAQNMHHLGEIYRFCGEIGADFFTPSLIKNTNIQFNGSFLYGDLDNACFYMNYPDHPYDIPELIKAVDAVRALKGRTAVRFYPRIKSTEALQRYLQRKDPNLLKVARRCVEPWSGFQINARGQAYPCLAFEVGNIRERNIAALWNADAFISFRERLHRLKLFPACVGCCYLYIE